LAFHQWHMKHKNKELREQFVAYLQENISKPADWDEQIIGQFTTTPTKTILEKYLVLLVEKHREGSIYEAIHQFYKFSGSLKTVEEQVAYIKNYDRAKSIENIFKGQSSSSEEALLFVAKIFQMPIQNLTDFESYLAMQTKEVPSYKSATIPKKITANVGRKLYSQGLVGFSVFSLIAISIGFYQTKQQLNQVDSMVFKPRYVGSLIQEKDTTAKQLTVKTAHVGTKIAANALVFFTNNIYNAEFLHSKQAWSFQTDPKGEDINSEYGEPYRREIMPLKPADLKNMTLANNEIWIRFNLQNEAEGKLYIDNLFLKIIAQYPVNEQMISYNAWITKFTEKHYEVLLNPFALSYPMATFIEIEGNESKHFSLKVKSDADKKIENQIIKFRIIASANDGKGNRYTIQSDKDYFLGFVKK